MRVFLFVATKKGLSVLKALTEAAPGSIVGVCSFREEGVATAFYDKIKERAEETGRFHVWKDVSRDPRSIVVGSGATHVITVGSRFVLPTGLNDDLECPMLVFHDSLLPKYRGFDPLPAAIINGESQVGLTVLFAADEVDSGDIVLQKSFKVGPDDRIADVIKTVAEVYADAVPELVAMMSKGKVVGKAQTHSKATYSIWRDSEDMQIDWRLPAEIVHNFVRAHGEPYLAAWGEIDGVRVTVGSSKVIDDLPLEVRQPGKIWKAAGPSAVVICGEGLLEISECKNAQGEKHDFRNLRTRFALPVR